MNTPANLPNSYHSSQTESVTKSDTHGSSEQTIHTETCRITETTLRMEHKSPLPDIEFNPSPRPFEIKDSADIHTNTYTNTNTIATLENSDMKPLTDIVSVPQHIHQPIHTEHDNSLANRTYEHLKYTTYETATSKEPQYIADGNTHQETVVAINGDDVIKAKNNGSVSNRIKTIENSANDEPIHKTTPIWNASNESPVTQFCFEKQSQRAISITPTFNATPYQNGTCTPNPVNETIEQISSKFQEYEQSHRSNDYDLKAPALVKHVTPIIKPYENGVQSSAKVENAIQVPVNLEPGEPPELCFAPRVSGKRRQSLVEKIEKTLEKDLERGPSKVLPHSVRMMPPSPRTISTEHYESSQRQSNIKQSKIHDINQPNTEINNLKHIFYEHNKPLQRNTIDFVPTPPKAPEKVRIWSVFMCTLCVCYTNRKLCVDASLNPNINP